MVVLEEFMLWGIWWVEGSGRCFKKSRVRVVLARLDRYLGSLGLLFDLI